MARLDCVKIHDYVSKDPLKPLAEGGTRFVPGLEKKSQNLKGLIDNSSTCLSEWEEQSDEVLESLCEVVLLQPALTRQDVFQARRE